MTEVPPHGNAAPLAHPASPPVVSPPTPGPRSGLRPGLHRPGPSIWRVPAEPPSPRRLTAAALAGGALALLLPSRPGLSVLLSGLVMVAAVAPAARRNRTSVIFAVSMIALLTVPVFRDAGWLTALMILLAVPLGSYAVTGGRGWLDLLGGGVALPVAVPHAAPWAGRGVAEVARSGRGPAWPLIRSALIAAGLLVVFGALFAEADAAFDRALGVLMPEISVGSLLPRLLVLVLGAGAVLTASYLAAATPRFGDLAPAAPRPAGRGTWTIPIAALDLLFAGFAAVQADVLLAADKERLLEGTGLTYAEYARQGFWQLSVVTVLVLAVIAVAVRYAPLGAARDRALVRVLLGSLCALTLVVVAVALRRLYLYEEAYGWTRLRIWVHAFELWIGLVIILIAVAGVRRGAAAWLPRAVALTGAAGLFALGAINPDGFIAARGVEHHRQTGTVDLLYLGTLSADAVPALDRLPEPQRSCALWPIDERLRSEEGWADTNLSRARARDLLARNPLLPPPPTCMTRP